MTRARASESRPEAVTTVTYEQLVRGASAEVSAAVGEAFGPGGLGIIAVRGVPHAYAEKRRRLLQLARQLAQLPPATLTRYEVPEVQYSVGWSRGRESFRGRVDTRKGSFYANPLHDGGDPSGAPPHFAHPNVWPSCEVPELRDAFMSLGALICQVGDVLAARCDEYVASLRASAPSLQAALRRSRCHKGRLLHYFADQHHDEDDDDDEEHNLLACGWHNDISVLTGLCAAAYHDAHGRSVSASDMASAARDDDDDRESTAQPPFPGLYVSRADGGASLVRLEPDALAFQIGEAAQIMSDGALRATPHAVVVPSAGASRAVTRSTLAVFMQPAWDQPLHARDATTAADTADARVPALRDRWRDGMRFAEFATATFAAYNHEAARDG